MRDCFFGLALILSYPIHLGLSKNCQQLLEESYNNPHVYCQNECDENSIRFLKLMANENISLINTYIVILRFTSKGQMIHARVAADSWPYHTYIEHQRHIVDLDFPRPQLMEPKHYFREMYGIKSLDDRDEFNGYFIRIPALEFLERYDSLRESGSTLRPNVMFTSEEYPTLTLELYLRKFR